MDRGRKAPTLATSRFGFRTPLLPLSAFTSWADGGELAQWREKLAEQIADPIVSDAIFVASPDLHATLAAWRQEPDSQRGQRVERALVRYFSRMASRPTPFGLFAAVSVGRFGGAEGEASSTSIVLPPPAHYTRSTRIDNDYLFALCEAVAADPAVRGALTYRPNSSLYRAGTHYRYAESRLAGKARSHHLVAIEPTEYLERTLERARGGARIGALARALVTDDPDITIEEAEVYVAELVDSQILVSHLSPNVTGAEPIHGTVARLRAAGCLAIAEPLAAAQADIEAIDAAGLGSSPPRYLAIAERLADLPTEVELGRLFQVDAAAPTPSAVVHPRVLSEIERAIETLTAITSKERSPSLDAFRDAFVGRYESREVPLALALDDEVGVGFGGAGDGADASPLLAGLPFPPAPGTQRTEWSPRQTHLLQVLLNASAAGAHEIVLAKADLEALKAAEPAELPDAFSLMTTVVARSAEAVDRGDFRIILEGAGGPSGARVLGRFCFASSEHDELVREHLRAEEALLTGAVFAEIAHLPEGRIGNILCRPVLRDYEIPYLGLSGAPPEKQIPISDLVVSVQSGRIVLRSLRLESEVIPRLTTAHNFNLRSLGIYRFLCSLQHQGTDGVGWSWGPFVGAPFLPRVRVGRHVLSRAQWRLSLADLAPLAEASKGAKKAKTPTQIRELRARVVAAARALRDARRLPRFVVLADGDNELPVDFDNELSVDSFASLIKNRDGAELTELYPGPDELIVEGPSGSHTHQLVIPFTRGGEPRTSQAQRLPGVGSGRFASGSEWLYAKIYAGTTTADSVLREAVWPLAKQAIASGAADRWFFLRYADPESHLRVRFNGDPDRLRGEVLPALEAAAADLLDRGHSWRFQLDTYERETARYGGEVGVALAEEWFWADSEAVCEIVELLDGDEGEIARWQVCLRGLDLLLDDLGMPLAAKRELLTRTRDGFAGEFRADTALKKELGSRFRSEGEALAALLARDPAIDAEHDYEPGFAALARRSERQREIAVRLHAARASLTTSLEDLAGSFMHMHVNRLLRSAQRANELVLYDFLKRHYDMLAARGD